MGRGHFSLDEQLAPGGAEADEMRGGAGLGLDEGGAGRGSRRACGGWPGGLNG
jgi:hypothetical protein